MIFLSGLKRICDISFYMTFASIVVYMFSGDHLILTFPIFVFVAFLASYLAQHGEIRYVSAVPLFLIYLIIPLTTINFFMVTPAIAFMIWKFPNPDENVKKFHYQSVFELFLIAFIAVLILFLISGALDVYLFEDVPIRLPNDAFLFAISFLLNSIIFMRLVRHDEAVLNQTRFKIMNVAVVVGVMVGAILFSTDVFFGFVGLIWSLILVPVLAFIFRGVAFILRLLGLNADGLEEVFDTDEIPSFEVDAVREREVGCRSLQNSCRILLLESGDLSSQNLDGIFRMDLGELSLQDLDDLSLVDLGELTLQDLEGLSLPNLDDLSLQDLSDSSLLDLEDLSLHDLSDQALQNLRDLPLLDLEDLSHLGLEDVPLLDLEDLSVIDLENLLVLDEDDLSELELEASSRDDASATNISIGDEDESFNLLPFIVVIVVVTIIVAIISLFTRFSKKVGTAALKEEGLEEERVLLDDEKEKKRFFKRQAENEIRAVYQRFLAAVKKKGLRIPSHLTSYDVEALVAAQFESEKSRELRDEYIRVRYGEANYTEEDVERIKALYKEVKAEIEI